MAIHIKLLLLSAMCVLCLHFTKAQTTPPFDCGLTYFYDAAGNRILRIIVTCGDPMGKTSDSTQTASDSKMLHTDSTMLATFQIVMIAPNPTAGPVDISCNQDLNNANVIVSDLNGKVALQTTANGRSIRLDISHLTAGSYTVAVTSKGNTTAKTLVKMGN